MSEGQAPSAAPDHRPPAGASATAAPPTSVRHPLTRALLVLTLTTGLVDAVSYLGLGHVFTANMTGNVVLLGFGIAGSGGLPVLAPLVSLGTFLVGAGAGGMLAARTAERRPIHFAYALAIEAAVVAVAALMAVVVHVRPGTAAAYALIVLLALAMGVRNATARRLSVPDMTTTVLTGTLTALATESVLFGGTGRGTLRRSAAVLAMLAGALSGALLLKVTLAVPLLLAAALALIALLMYLSQAGRDGGKPPSSTGGTLDAGPDG